MKHAMVILVAIIAALLMTAQPALSQTESKFQNSLISYQAVNFLHVDSSRIQVDIHYRIGQSFFIFVRNEAASPKTEYIARGEMLVELLNDQRVSVARQIRQLPLSKSTLPREPEQPQNFQGVISLSAPPGTYTIVFSVDDRESGRTFMDRERKITLRQPSSTAFETSDVFFVLPPSTQRGAENFAPVNRGGNVLFGEFGGVVGEVFQPIESDTLEVLWTLKGKAEGFGQRSQEFSGTAFKALAGRLELKGQNQGIAYSLAGSDKMWKTVYISVPLEKLQPGSFTLDVHFRCGIQKKTQTRQFSVVWPTRPLSLMDSELAVDALRHIASEEAIDAMQSGSEAKRAEAFSDFWKSQSSDTSTAYNVAMAEYYHRVDEAIRKYSTARGNDGFKTDRGRIYLLYGAPQKSDRILQPNSPPTEVWTYDRLQKRFIFIDTSKNGNYILSQSENL